MVDSFGSQPLGFATAAIQVKKKRELEILSLYHLARLSNGLTQITAKTMDTYGKIKATLEANKFAFFTHQPRWERGARRATLETAVPNFVKRFCNIDEYRRSIQFVLKSSLEELCNAS
ncbi:uncharacterized protein LOC124461465 [Drosophila willistoni]|uniref:uncharacterized protein LOC124461462 n=1 Tax=Drosophila willistoni TaxID=7260 RepID=UPI001F083DBA|nr:uncharacterized protein LOC124461462 [Drosophila willistoni]XP_046868947.1 uncharacterized protein LOC124461465 [Drosophila willistoni]